MKQSPVVLLFCSAALYTVSVFSMINHEKSKKHKDNVAALRDEMLADDEEFNLELSDNQETQASVATPQK